MTKYKVIISGTVEDYFGGLDHAYRGVQIRINGLRKYRDGLDLRLNKIQLEETND